jgi:hypothetical protein
MKSASAAITWKWRGSQPGIGFALLRDQGNERPAIQLMLKAPMCWCRLRFKIFSMGFAPLGTGGPCNDIYRLAARCRDGSFISSAIYAALLIWPACPRFEAPMEP